MNGRKDEESIQATHGRWINELQESLEVVKQNLFLLEKRVSNFENELAERARVHRKIKAEISSLRAEINKSCRKSIGTKESDKSK